MSNNTGKHWDIFLYEVTSECGGVNPLENISETQWGFCVLHVGHWEGEQKPDRYGIFGFSKKL